MNAKNKFLLLKEKLINDINKVDFKILKENWNHIFNREKHTRMIFEDDEIVPIFDAEWFGDDCFLKNEVIKDINYMCDRFSKNKNNDEARNFNFLIDNYYWLIQALAITLNLDFKKYFDTFINIK